MAPLSSNPNGVSEAVRALPSFSRLTGLKNAFSNDRIALKTPIEHIANPSMRSSPIPRRKPTADQNSFLDFGQDAPSRPSSPRPNVRPQPRRTETEKLEDVSAGALRCMQLRDSVTSPDNTRRHRKFYTSDADENEAEADQQVA